MTTIVNGLIAPSVDDPLYSVADTMTKLRDSLADRLSDTGWNPVPAAWYAAGWKAFTNADWDGFKYRVRLGFMFWSGAVTKTTAVLTPDTVLTVPTVAWRPTATWQVMGDDSYGSTRGAKPVIVRPDGRMILTNGSGQQTFSLSAFYPI